MTKATFSRRVSLGLPLLLAVCTIQTAGQAAQAPAGGRQKITFTAVGADGTPVADLKAAQVELKIDGKPRTMQALSFVKFAGPSADKPTAAAPTGIFDSPVPPPYGTNTAAAPSRTVLVAIDEESIVPGRDKPLKEALDAFIEGLGPQDRMSVLGMPHSAVHTDLTSSKAAIRDAVGKLSGRRPASRSDNDEACHTRDFLADLTGALGALGEGPATVMVFSAGITSPKTTTSAGSSAISCELVDSDFSKVGQAAAAARATVYVVLPDTSASATLQAGLQNLGGVVNSPLMNFSNADNALMRILRASSGYYVAEFDLDAAERDGKSHRVELKVSAADSQVRVPNSVTFAKPDAKGTKNAKDIVREPKIYTDLPMRVIGYSLKGALDKMNVIIMVEPVEAGTKFTSLSIGLVDPTGKITSAALREEELAKPSIVTTMAVVPGSYKLHVAAVDAAGRPGSVDYLLDATLTSAGPMKLSGLLVGAISNTGFMPKMEFKDEAAAVVRFEIYGAVADLQGASGVMELAATPDGPAIDKVAQLEVGPGSQADSFQAAGTFKLDKLAPGDYVVRVSMGVEGQPPGKIVRTLRKVK